MSKYSSIPEYAALTRPREWAVEEIKKEREKETRCREFRLYFREDGLFHEFAGPGVARGAAGPSGRRDQALGDDATVPDDESQVRPWIRVHYFLAHRAGEENWAHRGPHGQFDNTGSLHMILSLVYVRVSDVYGKYVLQSWRDIMDSIDQTAKLIKQQADSIENIVVDQLSTLYSERRRARKFYQEEQTWLNNQFQQVGKIVFSTDGLILRTSCHLNQLIIYIYYNNLVERDGNCIKV